MKKMEKLAAELRAEADIDFLDLPFIAASVRREIASGDDNEIRRHTLDLVRKLMEMDVFAGDYNLDDLKSGRGFQFRREIPDEVISWIEAEWIALGHLPTQEQPICWFSLRR
ncbi:hypothetical protein [Lichenibacterium dinghuense]|uniref:hypothetical protein n=1 Tax=Lichenibacterium dinghuense TaxID=2895977 RepID=UPI001F40A692|nr:hypothetical protein [Lichenibacterium sp. 6Y81]